MPVGTSRRKAERRADVLGQAFALKSMPTRQGRATTTSIILMRLIRCSCLFHLVFTAIMYSLQYCVCCTLVAVALKGPRYLPVVVARYDLGLTEDSIEILNESNERENG